MEPDRWHRIEELFHSALECAPAQRSALLDSACAGDASLRQEIESLLLSYEKGSFTETPAFVEGVRLLEDRESQSFAGRSIGPYKVIREIGRGGMGAVYLASRADQAFEKQVAIKLIKRGLDTDDVLRRFRGERQILASLDHPNITRLLDGGTTEDGLPYFVMEYIQGEPIDQFCDARKLNVTERLKLFQSVCAAVHFAHQNLVIHRDIKPGNISVTSEGVPRLLDFGIAKLLAPGPGATDRTMTIARPMTPESASPEQIRGQAITTATDVYSLGVLLYRLLTGRRPYPSSMSSPTEIEQAICEREIERPSIAVMRGEETSESTEKHELRFTPESLSETREGTPDKLRRRLEGDLDNIVLKALRKEPQRRYDSVEQLSQDIRRHLENLPVLARPDTPGYRAAKFIARHKAGVATAALLLLSLSAGIAATTWQARVAIAEGERARRESAKAQRINAFLQDMLSFSSPGYGSSNPRKDPDAKVSEVVDQAAKRAESELGDQPEVLAEMQRTIGSVYYAQGRFDQAEQILRSALDKYIRLYTRDRHETVETSNALANVLLRKGNTAEAESLFRRDIDIERKLAQNGHLDARLMAHALGDYGSMLDQKADQAAEGYLKEALQYASLLTGKDRISVAILDNDLGDVAYRRGDLKESERLNRAAIDEYRKLPEGTYVEMAATLSNLGAVLIKEGKYDEAEPVVREGLQLRRKLLGDSHPDTAMSFFRLSDLLYKKADYPGAENAARESIQVFSRAFAQPKDNAYFANPLLELGLILNKSARSREAETYLRQALEIRTRFYPKGNQLVGISEGALGECLTTQKRYAEAEPLLLRSYAAIQAVQGEQGPSTLEAKRRLSTLYQSWGKPAEAARYQASAP
ncbi:MAG TPA: serine/threonine-protein kinase [Candidatus Angelobacter sp.]|nr:serine/threonine-protein kinase [Candidatus Angelobacter sp.]